MDENPYKSPEMEGSLAPREPGETWNLLAKTNPNATPESVKRWAIYGAVAGPPAVILVWFVNTSGRWNLGIGWAVLILLTSIPLGACLGALLEWQEDSTVDNEDEDDA